MALVNSAFSVNVTPGAMPPIVHVSEYDTGRTYTVTINGQNGSAFNIPTGTTATVEGTLNGVIGFTTDATISGSTVSFTLTESMTAKSGKAWCKIKLTLNDEPIQTCAFVLAVDRAGVEAETVIGADGFEQQIVNAVNDWLDEHPTASGGMTEAFKQALLDCFENVAWINDQGQTYYDALYAALYPPANLVSISAVFTQGNYAVYATDSLYSLKTRLVVTGLYADSSTRTITEYTLSGTLAEGTSAVAVTYGGKTTTFNVTVLPDRTPVITNTGVAFDRDGATQTKSGWCVTDFYSTKFTELPFTLVIQSNNPQTVLAKTITYNSEKTQVNQYDVSNPRELEWPVSAGETPPPYFRTSINGNGSQSYAYVKESGEIIFAGVNSPYYRTITVPSE